MDFTEIDKLVELGASAQAVVELWKIAEKKRAAGLREENARDRLFREGLLMLTNMTGRPLPSCRSFIGKCLKAVNDDASIVFQTIEYAHENKMADAAAWIAAAIKKRGGGGTGLVKPEEIDWEAILATYKKTRYWSRWAGPDPESAACRAPIDLLEKHGIKRGIA